MVPQHTCLDPLRQKTRWRAGKMRCLDAAPSRPVSLCRPPSRPLLGSCLLRSGVQLAREIYGGSLESWPDTQTKGVCCVARSFVGVFTCMHNLSTCTCTHTHNAGALAFIIAWVLFLFLWSIPIIVLEYGVGRFTRKSVVESYGTLLGPSYRFMGAFMAVVTFLIA